MFDSPSNKYPLPLILLKRLFQVLLSVYLVIVLIAGYRAWYQVKSLDLHSTDLILKPGSAIETTVASYARTPVDVRVELIQGSHSETIAIQRVPDNEWALLDPRSRQSFQRTLLSRDILSRFETGQAHVRATAVGRPQWMRLPPPVVRELAVEIQRD